MAAANTLRPIAVPAAPAESSAPRGRFGTLGIAAWLCLAGMGSSKPGLHAQGLAPVESPSCTIKQRTPLYVGFAEGTTLDTFEGSALASSEIVREIKHWGCGASTSMAVAVPSLQLTFARTEALIIESLKFDDPEFVHAHVVLSSSASALQHWRVDLTQGPEAGWIVSSTGIASLEDLRAR